MPAESQPQYFEITVRCSCGNSFQTRSSVRTDFRVEICSACHPSGRVLRDASVFAEGLLNEPARMTAQR